MKILKPRIEVGMSVVTAGGINLGEISKVNKSTFECPNYQGRFVKEKKSDLFTDTNISEYDLILDK